MKVEIKHSEETTGLLLKKKWFGVYIKVDFSEEEQALIDRNQLWNHIVLERNPGGQHHLGLDEDAYFLYVRDLPRGDKHLLVDQMNAQEYEELLVGSLRNMKAALESVSEEMEDKRFEL